MNLVGKKILLMFHKVHVMDTSISENIAFGVDKENIDFNLVEKCSCGWVNKIYKFKER